MIIFRDRPSLTALRCVCRCFASTCFMAENPILLVEKFANAANVSPLVCVYAIKWFRLKPAAYEPVGAWKSVLLA